MPHQVRREIMTNNKQRKERGVGFGRERCLEGNAELDGKPLREVKRCTHLRSEI